nr:M28 family peptidase [Sphingomonas sp.]
HQSGNVIVEVPGRDPSAPPVLVACHLDSWDLGTGALDDAAGCGIVAAAAKRIMDAGRPLRPIRIAWFGAEEVGLFGGLDYRARHGKTPHHAIAESDFGAGRVWKVDSRLGEARKDEALALQRALAPLGIVPGALDRAGGSDIGPMIQDGLAAVGLNQDGTEYFDVHHSPDDTLDKVDRDDLRQNVAAWTAMLAVLTGGIEPEPKRRNGVERENKGAIPMRILIALPLLMAAGCDVTSDTNNDQVTLQYNQDSAQQAASDVGNTAEGIGSAISNEAQDTAAKIENTDVDVRVNDDGGDASADQNRQ